jgi:hypothetical protein
LAEGKVRGENVRAYERCFWPSDSSSGLCVNCGIPVDSQRFDESSIANVPDVGDEIVVASVDLPAQYCGTLEHVAQFTDLNLRRPDQVDSPGLEWTLVANGRALHPFSRLTRILNPWGFGSYRMDVRLDESAHLELIVRRTAQRTSRNPQLRVQEVGGRLVGRYWYNRGFGDVTSRAGDRMAVR